MRVKTVTYTTWVIAVTAVLAGISFLMLALSMHHATRSAHGGGGSGYGFHDGDF